MQLKSLIIMGLCYTLGACTLNEGNPHETVCLKLTQHLMGIESLKEKSQTKHTVNKDQTLSIHINWQNNQKGDKPLKMTSSCIYLSDTDDAGEDFNVRVEKSYQTVPDKMFINNQAVRPKELYSSIQNIMGISIRETSEKTLQKPE